MKTLEKMLSIFMAATLALSVLSVASPLFFAGKGYNAYAQTGEVNAQAVLPDPGTLPDNPFYGFKKFFESIGTAFTFGDDAKAERSVSLAETRLAEAKSMAEMGKPEFLDGLLAEYRAEISNANRLAATVEDEERKQVLAEEIAVSTSHHLDVLDEVKEKVPEQAKVAITAAKASSMKSNQDALRVLATEDPERATEIAMSVAEGRANKVKAAADAGNYDDAVEAANEYAEYEDFGSEIAAIAKQVGQNQTKVQELVDAATSIHQRVLLRVMDEVPDDAKTAIGQAMSDSEVDVEVGSEDNGDAEEEAETEEVNEDVESNDNDNATAAQSGGQQENTNEEDEEEEDEDGLPPTQSPPSGIPPGRP